MLTQLTRTVRRIETKDAHAPPVTRAVSLEDLRRSRLARTVRAEQAEDLSDRHRETHTTKRIEVPVGLAQVGDLDRVRHRTDTTRGPLERPLTNWRWQDGVLGARSRWTLFRTPPRASQGLRSISARMLGAGAGIRSRGGAGDLRGGHAIHGGVPRVAASPGTRTVALPWPQTSARTSVLAAN